MLDVNAEIELLRRRHGALRVTRGLPGLAHEGLKVAALGEHDLRTGQGTRIDTLALLTTRVDVALESIGERCNRIAVRVTMRALAAKAADKHSAAIHHVRRIQLIDPLDDGHLGLLCARGKSRLGC